MKRVMGMVASLFAVAMFATGCTNYVNMSEQQAGVVRGDDVKDRSVQDVLCPGGGAKDIGLDNKVRRYHTSESQRYFDMTREKGEGDPVPVETSDGTKTGVAVVIDFNTTLGCKGEEKERLLKFDGAFGGRPYPRLGGDGSDEDGIRVYQGDAGWGAFLDIELRRKVAEPVIKDVVGSASCADISTTCAALEVVRKTGTVTNVSENRIADNRTRLEMELVDALNAKLKEKMGDQYLEVTAVDIVDVELPQDIEGSVAAARVAYADVAKVKGELEQEKIRAQKSKIESEQFTKEQLAAIEIAKALGRGNATVYWNVDPSLATLGSGQ